MTTSALVFTIVAIRAALAGLGLFTTRWVPMPASGHGWLTLGYLLACCTLTVRPTERCAVPTVRAG